MSNLVLMGYRGVGKSSIAKIISKKLNIKIISTDAEIEKRTGNIKEFVEKNGWHEFRKAEKNVIKEIKKSGAFNSIIDCGGGVVEDIENVLLLKSLGCVIFLKAGAETIISRTKENKRPSLTGKIIDLEIMEVLEKRNPLYERAANIIIDAEKNTKEQRAEIIANLPLTEVCVSLSSKSVEDAKKSIHKALERVNLVEIRTDFIKDIDEAGLKNLVSSNKNCIIAFRRKKEKSLDHSLIEVAIKEGVRFIDLEIEEKEAIKHVKDIKLKNKEIKTKLIISCHNFELTPGLDELNSVYFRSKSMSADLVKIVTKACTINDNFAIFEFLKNKEDAVSFCMGMQGQISRILAGKYGSRITYCCLKEGKETAEGQISIKEMLETYNFNSITKETKVFGVIGEFAENSMSKHMHNSFFRRKNINAVYIPFKVGDCEELRKFMKHYREHIAGGSVTTPYKVEIMKNLDFIEEEAKKIGAVNTIVKKNNNELIGSNTDCHGVVEALKEKTSIQGKRILLIGAGGAARAACYALKKEGAVVTIINRTEEKAKEIADEFSAKVDSFSNMGELIINNDLIINSTSVGMKLNIEDSIIPKNLLAKGKIIMDMVYKPVRTKLIKNAEQAGCEIITGDRMLIHQALGQMEMWTCIKPEFKLMEENLKKSLDEDK